jgi:CRISPR-associated protein Cas1
MQPHSFVVPLTLQQLAGAALRLQQRKSALPPHADVLFLVEAARDRLLAQPYVAEPIPAFRKEEADKTRIIANPTPLDRVIDEALLHELLPSVEPLLTDAVHAYRCGRSTYSAAQALAAALSSGQRHLALLDIAAYYDNLDRDALAAMLRPLLRPVILELLIAQLAAPLRLDGEIIARPQGIPIGRGVSPVVANAFLSNLDHLMQTLPCTYLRYGDDLLIAATDNKQADRCETELRSALVALRLSVAEHKTQRIEYTGTPVAYLGHLVNEHGVYEKVADNRLKRITAASHKRENGERGLSSGAIVDTGDIAPAWRRLRTLYVTESGVYLSFREGLAVVRRGKEVLREIPFRTIDRVLVLAGAAMSSGFISACIVRNIPLLVFVNKGRAYGSLVAAGMPNPLRLRAQYDLLADPVRRMSAARAIVGAKLKAMERRLGNLSAAAPRRKTLRELGQRAANTTEAESLRGVEGQATKIYYEGFAMRIKRPEFAFDSRSRQPPKDAVNSLMSFSYSLVFGEMQTSLLACGLDPHAGLFHELRPGHPALASDLIEPYRSLIGDSFVLSLINQGMVTQQDFQAVGQGVFLTHEGRRSFLTAYEGFMVRPLGGSRGHTTPRGLIQAGARAFLHVVIGETDELVLPLLCEEQCAADGDTP